MFLVMKIKKFIFEYPQDWVKNGDYHNMIFMKNITSSLIEMNLLVSLLPVSYPTYGIPRNNTSNFIYHFIVMKIHPIFGPIKRLR